MNDSKDERNLHLVTIEVLDTVGCQQPDRINSKWIGFASVVALVLGVDHEGVRQLERIVLCCSEVHGDTEVGTKDVEGLGEDVIVDETGIDGEASHQEDDVASSKEYLEYLRVLHFLLKTTLLHQ